MNRKVILSTCGTSLLTNNTDNDVRKLVTSYANVKTADEISDPAVKARLQQHIEERSRELGEMSDLAALQRLSAELNGIIRLYEGRMDGHAGDHHILVCTDTWLGSETARMLAAWLRSRTLSEEVWRITDLQTAELERFSLGMADLVKRCDETFPGYREQQYHVTFNLTGGFKSVQGFLQTLGLFYADESVYTFESGRDLLRLPRLPIKLDAADILKKSLQVVRRSAVGLPLEQEAQAAFTAPLFMTIDGEATLSPWGELIWKQQSKAIMAEKALPLISPKLIYGPDFVKSVDRLRLNGERTAQLHLKLDDLAAYLETKQSLKGLDFKQLKTSVKAPSTHECDAWHDQGAKRIFGHFEGEIFILDELAEKLPS